MANVGSIRLVSQRKGGTKAERGETLIAIDRTNLILGNRHYAKDRSPEERRRVIKANAKDLADDIQRNGIIFKTLVGIADRVIGGERIALVCWCHPKDCHGDNYIAVIKSIIERKSK